MSALELLEENVRAEQHASSRAMAKGTCRRVSEILADGQRPDVAYRALDLLYHRFRDEGHAVERDAMAEVMDWTNADSRYRLSGALSLTGMSLAHLRRSVVPNAAR